MANEAINPLKQSTEEIQYGVHMNKQDKKARDAEVMDIMTKNQNISDNDFVQSYSFRTSDGILAGIKLRTVQELRKKWKEKQLNISKKGIFEISNLPNQISPWQKLPGGGFGFPEAPSEINGFLITVPPKLRRKYYHYLRRILEKNNWRHWVYWRNNKVEIQKIHNIIDELWGTEGLSLKNKTRANVPILMLRRLLKWDNWGQGDIEKYFPAPHKLKPLKNRIANAELLYFYPEEQWKNYLEVINIVMDELPNHPKQYKHYDIIYREGFKLYCYIASDTATREGQGHAYDNQNVDLGNGILGIRIPNITWNYGRVEGYTDFYLQDKGRKMWHKVIQPKHTKQLKKYLKLHREFYPDGSDMLFPSNNGLKRLRLPQIYDSKLPLWSLRKIYKLFDLVNKRFYHLHKVPKGNPNLVKNCPCSVRTHIFRHNAAVWSIIWGLNIPTTCKRLGWSNVQTFCDTYADIVPTLELSQWVLQFRDTATQRQLEQEGRFTQQSIKKQFLIED